MSQIFDRTTRTLESALDARLTRHNVTSANIANAETPGYVAKKVEFEEDLIRALATEDARSSSGIESSIDNARASITDNPDAAVNNDKNTVDLEKEMSTLAENTILYRTAIELIKKKLGTMKYAVTEGGR
jgi:flagellar basal-body rod protein FlgB